MLNTANIPPDMMNTHSRLNPISGPEAAIEIGDTVTEATSNRLITRPSIDWGVRP